MQYVGICDICGYFSVPFPIHKSYRIKILTTVETFRKERERDVVIKVSLCIWTLCFHKWNTLNNDVFKTSIVVFHKVLQCTNSRKLFTHIQWFFTSIFGLLIAFLFSHKTHTGGFIDSCTHYSPLPAKIFLSTKWKHKSIYLFQMV